MWSLVNLKGNDQAEKKSALLSTRTPFLEFPIFMATSIYDKMKADKRRFEEKPLSESVIDFHQLEVAMNLKSPRVVHTHLPVRHLPPNLLEKAKVIYVCRNPKDQIVSWYKMLSIFSSPDDPMTVDQFAIAMMEEKIAYGGYFKHLKVRKQNYDA